MAIRFTLELFPWKELPSFLVSRKVLDITEGDGLEGGGRKGEKWPAGH